VLWQILAHVAITLRPKNVSEFLELLYPALLLKDSEFFLSWKYRKLERNVEGMLLLVRSLCRIGFSVPHSDNDKPTIS
jgi:hypothetical protein